MSRPAHILLVEAPYYAHIADHLRKGAERALAEAGASLRGHRRTGSLRDSCRDRNGRAVHRTFRRVCCARLRDPGGDDPLRPHLCGERAGLQDLAVRDGLAIGYGILTVENEAQALARASAEQRDKGGEAVRACLALVVLKRRLAGEENEHTPTRAAAELQQRPGEVGRRSDPAGPAAAASPGSQRCRRSTSSRLNRGVDPETVVREFALHRLGHEIDGDRYGEADPGTVLRYRPRRGGRSRPARRDNLRGADRRMAAGAARCRAARHPAGRHLRAGASARCSAARLD